MSGPVFPPPGAEPPEHLPPPRCQSADVAASPGRGAARPGQRAGVREAEAWARAWVFPLAKLRGLTAPLRAALKGRGITTCGALLGAAGPAAARGRLAREAGIDPGALLALARRADLARVGGVGAVFGLMLEDLEVSDVRALAAREPGALHVRLLAHHRAERLARRAPTPGEVEDWVGQARRLPPLVEGD